MNPAFVIVIGLILIALWFLLSALYKPIGMFLYKIFDDSRSEMKYEDEEETIGITHERR